MRLSWAASRVSSKRVHMHKQALLPSSGQLESLETTIFIWLLTTMKVVVKNWHAIAQWKWDTGNNDADEGDVEGDVCGICRVPYEGCCPTCKMPGDDCPLSTYHDVY